MIDELTSCKAVEIGVESMLPKPRESIRTPKIDVVVVGSSSALGLVIGTYELSRDVLAIGRTKPVHRLVHPPARQPYMIPYANTPGSAYDNTPQRT